MINRKGIFLLVILSILCNLLFGEFLHSEERVTNQILVKFKPISPAEISQIHQENKVKLIKEIKILRIYQVEISTETTLENTIQKYRENPNVLYAEPNYIGKTFATIPNDMHFDKQWAIKKIELDKAWDLEKGKPEVIVAVLDTGIDLNHPDLKENVIAGYDFVNNDSEPMDDNGHGTLVAGVIVARGDNNEGIAGVSWYSKIMPIKITNKEGIGDYFTLAQGIIYAVDNGARIINLSIGGYAYSELLKEAVDYGLNGGCVLVAGVGDKNTNTPVYPADYEGVIGVAATDPEDKIFSQSNYGEFIDLYAPGVEIYSTALNGEYAYRSGSSLASAYVSGLVGLVLSADSSLTYEEVKKILYAADYVRRDDYKTTYGYGRINAYRSILTANKIENVDISVVDLKVVPEKPTTGQPAEVIVTLQNQGNVATTETKTRLYVDEIPLDTVITVPPLAPNEITVKTFTWIP